MICFSFPRLQIGFTLFRTTLLAFLALAVVLNAQQPKRMLKKASPPPRKSERTGILLPIEVVGPAGSTREVTFELPPDLAIEECRMSLLIHRLDYPDKVSVKVNELEWIPINEERGVLEGLAKAYGGIGGGFHTISMTVRLPLGALKGGTNVVSFRFNKTDGDSSGFRVLAFNFLGEDRKPILPPEAFVEEDPSLWQSPLLSPEDIEEGKRLWYTAQLTMSPLASRPLQARCADCHAHDGRDLKYFNYSNDSIRERSVFHGLTSRQGDQIASYIRSLAIPNPGRPWNPPYQPGPGLDSKPIHEWAAGAGLGAVLERDLDTLRYIPEEQFGINSNLSARETPIAMQLPDWNAWLPKTHPKDGSGDRFLNSDFYRYYGKIRSGLRQEDVRSFQNVLQDISHWDVRRSEFFGSFSGPWTAGRRQEIYSASLWKLVKLWEVMNEFELEGYGKHLYGPQSDDRVWWDHDAFLTSPNMLHIPPGPGIGNGLALTHTYTSYIWYHLQLILNNSNKRQGDNAPIDWPYTYGFIKGLSSASPNSGLLTLWLVKALQISENGKGPEVNETEGGWQWRINDLSRLIHADLEGVWADTPPTVRAEVTNRWIRQWFQQVSRFAPERFYARSVANPTEKLVSQFDGSFGERVWYSIPRLRYFGLDPALTSEITRWAETVWPGSDWNRVRRSECVANQSTHLICTHEH